MWEMTATSLHNDVFQDSEHVTSERPIALVLAMIRWWEALRVPEIAKWHQKKIELRGMPRKGVMEEFHALSGRLCWRWHVMHEKGIEERQHWFLLWRQLSIGSVFQLCGLGRRSSSFRGICVCFSGTSSISGELSLKDVWPSRSRPSWLFCQEEDDCIVGAAQEEEGWRRRALKSRKTCVILGVTNMQMIRHHCSCTSSRTS